MIKFVRIIFSILLLIAIVAVIAFACLVMFVDPNQLKPVIAKEVMRETGYELKIDGDLGWSFYPHLGVKIRHMTLSEPQKAPFIDLYDVTIASEVKQLLKGTQKLQGEVHIGTMKLFNLQIKQAYVGLHWQKDLVVLEPISAKLYGGTLKGVAHGRDLSAMPRWDWSMQAKQINVKPLLQDVNGATSKVVISGVGEVSLTAETQGKTRNELFSHLNGVSKFSLLQGTVEGIDLNYLVKTADALLNSQPVAVPEHSQQTVFEHLTGTATINNGVAAIDNLLLVSQAFTTTGSGSIDLTQQQINYRLQVTPLHSQKIRWMVPVIVTGDLRNPAVRIDADMLKTMVANEQFQKVKSRVEEEVKKLPEKADKLIQKLLH